MSQYTSPRPDTAVAASNQPAARHCANAKDGRVSNVGDLRLASLYPVCQRLLRLQQHVNERC